MWVLTLDAALASCSAGVVEDEILIAEEVSAAHASLAAMAARVLGAAGDKCDLIAVTVGPGSFTGLRAALAVAHGIAIGAGWPIRGVSVAEALAAEAPAGREFWAAIDTKRGRVFLDRAGAIEVAALDALPSPTGKVAVAGDAAVAVATRWAAQGIDVQLLPARRPSSRGIALAALAGPGRPAMPLYVDPVEARPGPAARPAPSG